MTRVFWLSNETPDRHGQGGQRRQYFQIAALVAAGHEIRVVTLSGPQDDTSVRDVADDVHRVPRLEARGRVPLHWRRRALRRRLAEWGEAIVIAHGESWERFEWALPPAVPALVDLHNVYSRWPTEDSPGAAERWRALEQRIRRSVTAVSVTSTREAEALPGGPAEVIVVENGVDPEEWTLEPVPAEAPVLKLFGNWGWAPNTLGVEWFLSQVWPQVCRVTSARCVIAGSGLNPDSLPTGATAAGRVPDLQRFLADAWAIALPLPESVGSPVKYAEALAVGCPVITTTQGAPGHRSIPVIADTAQQWVDTLTEWLSAPTPSAVLDNRERADRLSVLSWARATEPLSAWVRSPHLTQGPA
ncbi:glycosyltransferase family 4 protein [Janibacter hoylei]|uniref:glycosyltransferase family 4 protein n=1 Tax=Janibacter hoylei TaxID=364298 RepID=UPI0027B9E6FE|nr:glycosyltransferase family 4 protein [Janibacter hoylei]